MPKRSRNLPAGLATLCIALAPAIAGAGQVTIDGTLGPARTLSGPLYSILPADGAVRGTNLFHSFGLFSLSTGDTADFVSTGMSNIIARVTGGSLSSINGTVQATQPGVNLYLVNPAGITFGASARLNVAGSFYASTANYLKLADGGRIDASNPPASVLTAAAPSAFGFLGPGAAAVTVDGSGLFVPEGRTLGLIGGNLTLRNNAYIGTATGAGAVQLVAVASAGEARIAGSDFDVGAFARLGEVSITGSQVDVSECCGRTAGAGTILVRSGRLVVNDATLNAGTATGASGGVDLSVRGDIAVENGSLIDTRSGGGGRAGNIAIAAGGNLTIAESELLSQASGDGRAGDIGVVAGGTLTIQDSSVKSQSFGRGRGGDIRLAADALTVDASSIRSDAFDDGNAGAMRFEAGTLALRNGSEVDSSGALFGSGAGRGGNLDISVAGSMSLDDSVVSSKAHGNGDAGSIRIAAGSLAMTNGAAINSGGASSGTGRGGNITILSDGTVSLNNSRITSEALGDGDAGAISITAGNVSLANFAEVNSSGSVGPGRGGDVFITAGATVSLDNATITSKVYGDGDAGRVEIRAQDFSMTRSASIDSGGELLAGGRGGEVVIAAGGTATLDDSSIMTSVFGQGNAGTVRISAGNIRFVNGALVDSSSAVLASGRGGNVILTARDSVLLDGSRIRSRAEWDGDAGRIEISARDVRLARNATIDSSSSTAATGRGGDIRIAAAGGFSMDAATITSETLGNARAGDITINASTFGLANGSLITSAGGDIFFTGRGGNIGVTVGATLSVDDSTITSRAYGDGDAGTISIRARDVSLVRGGKIDSSSDVSARGRGGDILIDASESFAMNGATITAETVGDARAGDIRISAGTFRLSGDALITSAAGDPGYVGRGGDIGITVAGAMVVDGSTISSKAFGDGDAGHMRVSAGDITLANGGRMDSSSRPGSLGRGGDLNITAAGTLSIAGDETTGIFSGTAGRGDAGSVNITAGALVVSGGLISASTENIGRGGDISIAAAEQVTVNSGGGITARSTSADDGAGAAGSITIDAGGMLLLDNGSITTSTRNAAGGNITIQAGQLIRLKYSTITTSALGGVGNGGNISIDPIFLILDHSTISANAEEGHGGDIHVVAGNIFSFPDPVSETITATSKRGVSGTITLSSPLGDLTGSLVTLPTAYLSAGALLAERCAARLADTASSFVATGRGGMPVEPEGLLPGALATADPPFAAGGAVNHVMLALAGPYAGSGGCTGW